MRHCEHVKSDGHFCGSPALRGRNYCYFHLTLIGRRLRAEKQAQRNQPSLDLPPLEDAASIQLALMQVTDALLRGTLDPKRGGLVLYALQTASTNLRSMTEQAEIDDEAHTAACCEYDSFEEDYELDDTIDLREPEPYVDPSPQAAARRVLDDAAQVGLHYPEPAPGDEKGDPGERRPDKALWNPKGYFTDPDILCFDFSKPGDPPPRPTEFNPGIPIPAFLTRKQYEQAQVAIYGYEKHHRIDHRDPQGLRALRERPATSQKMFLGRKPPASVPIEEEDTIDVAVEQ